MLDVDPLGLDVMDRKLLLAVIEKIQPAGRSASTISPRQSARSATPLRTCSSRI